MAEDRRKETVTPAEAADAEALAPFFAAARAAPPEPSVRLLSAILADAAGAGAPRRVPAPAAPERGRWREALAPLLGDWRGGAALAACALLGFWLGLAGGVTIDGATLQAGAVSVADSDPIETFFDLAAVE